MFQALIKDLYKAMNFRDDFIHSFSTRQLSYQFTSVLQFFDDIRYLSIRFGD